MTPSEILLFFVAPAIVLAVFLLLQKKSAVAMWTVSLTVVVGVIALMFLIFEGGQVLVSSLLIGGPLIVMLWVLRWSLLANRPILQLVLGLPIYLLALVVFLSVAVAMGLISP